MEIIPVLRLKRGKIVSKLPLEEIKKIQFGGKKVYVLDEDGILKDKPNVSIYQQMARYHETWVDAGPRNAGDLVDIIIAGADIIILRMDRWYDLDIDEIRELTENPLYIMIDIDRKDEYDIKSIISSVNGITIFTPFEKISREFIIEGYLKKLCEKNIVYAYEYNPDYVRSWENIGIKGLLVEIDHLKEFERHGL